MKKRIPGPARTTASRTLMAAMGVRKAARTARTTTVARSGTCEALRTPATWARISNT